MRTSRPIELFHIDLFGPTTYPSIGGKIWISNSRLFLEV
jgi:hypothetical protein